MSREAASALAAHLTARTGRAHWARLTWDGWQVTAG